MTHAHADSDAGPPTRSTHARWPRRRCRAGRRCWSLAVAAAGVALLSLLLGWSLVGWPSCSPPSLFIVALPLWSRAGRGRPRSAKDRLVTSLVWSAFVARAAPAGLAALDGGRPRGSPRSTRTFLTYSMRNVVGEGGGIYHAIIGTLLVTALRRRDLGPDRHLLPRSTSSSTAAAGWPAGSRFLVDVMTGIPSIVAGLFAYALFVLFFGEGVRMGFGGSVALSVLMIPVVVRSTEEMLKLVPDELREASYALGVPKWRTIVKVVLPDRAGRHRHRRHARDRPRHRRDRAAADHRRRRPTRMNFNLFDGRMMTLPVFIYYPVHATRASRPSPAIERAWGAALVLIVIVMVLNLVARVDRQDLLPQDRADALHQKRNHHGQEHRRHRPGHLLRRLPRRRGCHHDRSRARSVTAFIGPSGCGKSTFLRSLNRMHEVIPGARVEGKVVIDGQRPLRRRRRPGRGPPPDRHGLPAAQPVPDDVDLRERARRACG